jgi:hypothetical protein
MSDTLYTKFTNYIQQIVHTQSLTDFKNHDSITYMLEHVSFEQGKEYLQILTNKTPLMLNQIMSYCKENDRIGGGKKYDYGFITTSPSNFRYLLHAHLILSHMNDLKIDQVPIVEVGCGYGGLCLALNQLSAAYNITITAYYLVDLPMPNRLQQIYLSHFNIPIKMEFHSAYTYGKDIQSDSLFFVSNYCFSEIDREHQTHYIQHLFPKVSYGFMAWNNIPLYHFGFTVKVEKEYPLTGPFNKYIYF